MRWTWWAVAAGAALLSASQWLHAPSVEYLVPLVVATVAALIAGVQVPGAQRWWALGCAICLAAASGLAAPAQRGLWVVQHDWERWRRSSAIDGVNALHTSLDDAVRAEEVFVPVQADEVDPHPPLHVRIHREMHA